MPKKRARKASAFPNLFVLLPADMLLQIAQFLTLTELFSVRRVNNFFLQEYSESAIQEAFSKFFAQSFKIMKTIRAEDLSFFMAQVYAVVSKEKQQAISEEKSPLKHLEKYLIPAESMRLITKTMEVSTGKLPALQSVKAAGKKIRDLLQDKQIPLVAIQDMFRGEIFLDFVKSLYCTNGEDEPAEYSELNFSGTRLQRLEFNESNWNKANCIDTDFFGSIFYDASFANVNARFANLSNCALQATLSSSDISYGVVKKSVLIDANMTNTFCYKTNFYSSEFLRATLKKATITLCNMDECDLREANFKRATIDATTFEQADLTGACFDHASLSNLDLTNAYTKGCSFFGAKINKVKFNEAYGNISDDEILCFRDNPKETLCNLIWLYRDRLRDEVEIKRECHPRDPTGEKRKPKFIVTLKDSVNPLSISPLLASLTDLIRIHHGPYDDAEPSPDFNDFLDTHLGQKLFIETMPEAFAALTEQQALAEEEDSDVEMAVADNAPVKSTSVVSESSSSDDESQAIAAASPALPSVENRSILSESDEEAFEEVALKPLQEAGTFDEESESKEAPFELTREEFFGSDFGRELMSQFPTPYPVEIPVGVFKDKENEANLAAKAPASPLPNRSRKFSFSSPATLFKRQVLTPMSKNVVASYLSTPYR